MSFPHLDTFGLFVLDMLSPAPKGKLKMLNKLSAVKAVASRVDFHFVGQVQTTSALRFELNQISLNQFQWVNWFNEIWFMMSQIRPDPLRHSSLVRSELKWREELWVLDVSWCLCTSPWQHPKSSSAIAWAQNAQIKTEMGMGQYLYCRYIFSGMNIHLPVILRFTRYQGFDPSPDSTKNLSESVRLDPKLSRTNGFGRVWHNLLVESYWYWEFWGLHSSETSFQLPVPFQIGDENVLKSYSQGWIAGL